jgi:hypothetical protein
MVVQSITLIAHNDNSNWTYLLLHVVIDITAVKDLTASALFYN